MKGVFNLKRLYIYLIYALCGIIMALPYSYDFLWPFAWLAFIPVLFLEFSLDYNVKHKYLYAYRRGFSFFYPYSVMIFYWFKELYPMEFTGMSHGAALCVVLLGIFGLSLIQTFVWAFYMVFITALRSAKQRWLFIDIIFPALLWPALEWIQTLTWLGVPWGKLALGQTAFLPAIQSSSLLGPYFIAFVLILFSSLIATGLRYWIKLKKRQIAVISFVIAVAVFVSNIVFGLIHMISFEENNKINQLTAAAVQGNFSSTEKWSNDLSDIFDTYNSLTLHAAENNVDLVLWPETAIPVSLNRSDYITSKLKELADEANITLLVGAFYRNNDDKLENAIFLFDGDGVLHNDFYSKRHLVPFGEYVPWRNLIMTIVPPLNEVGMLDGDLAPGEGGQLIKSELGIIGSLVCFDSIYESLARDSVKEGAEILCVSTNDSWFSDSVAVFEHNRDSILRAVENGRYIVRSANTGVSSIISSTGKTIVQLDPLVRGVVSASVYTITEKTLYTRVGNIFIAFSWTLVSASLILTRKKFKKNGN